MHAVLCGDRHCDKVNLDAKQKMRTRNLYRPPKSLMGVCIKEAWFHDGLVFKDGLTRYLPIPTRCCPEFLV